MRDIKHNNTARILIIGDVMLDRYWFGEVKRISPEAPVPIVLIQDQEERLGGAANVACNVATLGAKTGLLGIIGQDEAGFTIKRLLNKLNINNYLNCNATVSTIIKLRIIGHQQQLIRVDFEKMFTDSIVRDKLAKFKILLHLYDIIILSDYAKGSLINITDIINTAKQYGKKILIDPKSDDFTCYQGANILTPNCSELARIIGRWKNEEELTNKVQHLRQFLQLEAILLTRSEKGMTLYLKDNILHFPAVTREVYDVSGAGDTVIATLAVMLGKGIALGDAANIANQAAGIVIGKLGTATVTYRELAL